LGLRGNIPSSVNDNFTRTGTNWTQQTKLLASDGVAADRFGWRVSLSGDTALFGVRWDGDNGVDSGSAYIFTKTVENRPPATPTITGPNSGKLKIK
jgi:hypothetical protein